MQVAQVLAIAAEELPQVASRVGRFFDVAGWRNPHNARSRRNGRATSLTARKANVRRMRGLPGRKQVRAARKAKFRRAIV